MRSALMPEAKPIILRGPSGLGDAIYVRPIADYLVRSAPVVVLSNWPDVFRDTGVEVRPQTRPPYPSPDIVAHYVHGRGNPGTNQWQDMCSSARIQTIPFRFSWTARNPGLVEDVRARAAGRRIVLVHGGHEPMDRADRFGTELRPGKAAFDLVLDALKGCFRVRVGKVCRTGPGYELASDLDLREKTSVSDLLDLGATCHGWAAQCSLAVPMAEALGKPLLAVWSSQGLRSERQMIRQLTPKKVLSGPLSRFVVDDFPPSEIREAALQFEARLA